MEILDCNHDLKKTFAAISFDYFNKKPFKSSKGITDICPFLGYSCCSPNELKNLFEQLKPRTKLIDNYYDEIEALFEILQHKNH